MKPAKPDETAGDGWSIGARGLVSAAVLFHLVALLVGVFGAAPPFSEVERRSFLLFKPYYDLIDQGYPYQYYAPEPPPTPVVEATVHYADGRPDEVVRLPRRGALPRLRYQRELALAYWMHADYDQNVRYYFSMHEDPEKAREKAREKCRWPRAYARHICKTHPGSDKVSIHWMLHRIPPVERIREGLEGPRRKRVDLDADEFYDTREWIGDYPCDAF